MTEYARRDAEEATLPEQMELHSSRRLTRLVDARDMLSRLSLPVEEGGHAEDRTARAGEKKWTSPAKVNGREKHKGQRNQIPFLLPLARKSATMEIARAEFRQRPNSLVFPSHNSQLDTNRSDHPSR